MFVDPSNVNAITSNYIMFIIKWICGSFFHLSFEINFINPKKIKISIDVFEWDIDRPLNANAKLFDTSVPEITSPSWVEG